MRILAGFLLTLHSAAAAGTPNIRPKSLKPDSDCSAVNEVQEFHAHHSPGVTGTSGPAKHVKLRFSIASREFKAFIARNKKFECRRMVELWSYSLHEPVVRGAIAPPSSASSSQLSSYDFEFFVFLMSIDHIGRAEEYRIIKDLYSGLIESAADYSSPDGGTGMSHGRFGEATMRLLKFANATNSAELIRSGLEATSDQIAAYGGSGNSTAFPVLVSIMMSLSKYPEFVYTESQLAAVSATVGWLSSSVAGDTYNVVANDFRRIAHHGTGIKTFERDIIQMMQELAIAKEARRDSLAPVSENYVLELDLEIVQLYAFVMATAAMDIITANPFDVCVRAIKRILAKAREAEALGADTHSVAEKVRALRQTVSGHVHSAIEITFKPRPSSKPSGDFGELLNNQIDRAFARFLKTTK